MSKVRIGFIGTGGIAGPACPAAAGIAGSDN